MCLLVDQERQESASGDFVGLTVVVLYVFPWVCFVVANFPMIHHLTWDDFISAQVFGKQIQVSIDFRKYIYVCVNE